MRELKIRNAQRILLIKMSSLGDIMTALPVLAALRRARPQAYIAWAVQTEFQSVLPGTPYLDEIIPVQRARIRSPKYWLELGQCLREKRFDCVLDLQMIAKSALVAILSGATQWYGYWEAREGAGLVSRPLTGENQYGHITARLLDVLRELGIAAAGAEYPLPDIQAERREVRQQLAEVGMNKPFAVVVPGSRGAGKVWPVSRWQEVVAHLLGYGVAVAVMGSAAEQSMVDAIVRPFAGREVLALAGKTTLRQLMAWEAEACLHISGDTGPLHIANALRTPLIGVYGPTLPERSGPYLHPRGLTAVARQFSDRPLHAKRDNRVDMQNLSVQEVTALIDWQWRHLPISK